jgi:hypothetical protein
MPARHAQHPIFRAAVLALSVAATACDGTDSPVASDGAEPLASEGAAE